MATVQKPKNPSWWTKVHDTGWAKVKHSLQVGWDLATGTTGNGGTFHGAEPALRFGFGARMQHGVPNEDGWAKIEAQLAKEWGELHPERAWEEARPHVMQGWHAHTRHIKGEAIIGTTPVRSVASGFGAGSPGDSGSGSGD